MIQERGDRPIPFDAHSTNVDSDQQRAMNGALELIQLGEAGFYHRLVLYYLATIANGATVVQILNDPDSDLNESEFLLDQAGTISAVNYFAKGNHPLVTLKGKRIYLTQEGSNTFDYLIRFIFSSEDEVLQ